jgi:hypothetical protein
VPVRARFAGPALLVAVAATLLGAQPSLAASARSETHTLGQVQATLSYTKNGDFDFRDVHLVIKRAGRTVLDAPVPPPCAQCPVIPSGASANVDSLQLVDLERDGEPEAIVDLFTGGAHCCSFSVIYGYHPGTDSYSHRTQDWRDPSYNLVDIDHDGRPELRSADARFAYEFTAYVFSAFPVQIWHYSGGAMVDVTRQFPNQIRHDVKSQRSRYRFLRRHHYDVRGALAAYAADEYLLDRGAVGMRLVYNALHRGELKKHDGDFGPFERRYIKRLRRFLHSLGYR